MTKNVQPGESGTLYVVGTPIGNLEDLSYRAIRILKEVDLIAAEDTRHSIKLLSHLDIHTKMIAYHKFNEREAGDGLRALLRQGKNIALISDAGMPVISDPGYLLVADCRKEGLPVTVIPGPNAALCGVVLSGLDCRRFKFMGFLEKSNKALRDGIEEVAASPCPCVLYESPHRLTKVLAAIDERLPKRLISISREITKQYEETLRGTASEFLAHFEEKPPKGEFVLVIEGRGKDESSQHSPQVNVPVEQAFADYLAMGLSQKDAMKQIARDRHLSRREVYGMLKINGVSEQ